MKAKIARVKMAHDTICLLLRGGRFLNSGANGRPGGNLKSWALALSQKQRNFR